MLTVKALFLVALFGLVVCFPYAQAKELPKQEPAKPTEAQQGSASYERGTKELPIVVEIAPSKPLKIETDRDKATEEEKAESDRWIAGGTIALAFFTFVLVCVTAYLAHYTKELWGATNRLSTDAKQTATQQASDMQESLRIARESAKATVDSASTSKTSMIASGRAYVHFNGCRWISHHHIDDGHIFWRVSVNWINSGNTPTRGLQLYTRHELRDDQLPIEFEFVPNQTELSPVTIYPKGFASSGEWDITGTDLDAISKYRKYLYIWGIAVYRDVFPDTKEHITRFCVFATNLSGDPLRPWHAETNPFNITFANYLWHNCADEDCDNA